MCAGKQGATMYFLQFQCLERKECRMREFSGHARKFRNSPVGALRVQDLAPKHAESVSC